MQSLRILVIDDNVDAANLLGQLLRLDGYEVAVAHDGAHGLACFESFAPDLAILDIGLPTLDGWKLAERVRADARFSSIPLIAITAYDAPADRARSREVGIDHHLSKPVDVHDLERLLASYALHN